MCNVGGMFLVSGGGGLLCGGLSTSFASALGSILGVNAGSRGEALVGLSGG